MNDVPILQQPPSYYDPPSYGTTSNSYRGSNGLHRNRTPVCVAQMDEEGLSDFMISHACLCSILPPFSCLCLQPLRVLCCAKSEGLRQAQATRLVLYTDELELQLDSYCQCCACVGAGPAPRPESAGLCGETGKMIKILPLDQISQITVFNYWQLNSIRIVSATPLFTMGKDSSIVTINGIVDAEEFAAAILNQMKIVKNYRRNYPEPSGNV
ncbi:hypothetical protein TrispH2_000304 [Trichoplax sp. H2]|nr:hypothetical protein TrispH2_000304 [Trichoplax sp. H2]|eukprot:RDD47327.1 hypothetical protein TrispH2_000304 [Trichoplax sp. H2]